tara:strand:+ start:231 stop:1982 length:1752 start_codon:yes stop_codon:yes gene_type:complete
MRKKLNKVSFTIIILIVFFLGISVERFDVDKKVSNNLSSFTDQIYQYFYSLSNNNERLYLFIEPRHYRKILKVRDSSIEKTMLTKDLEDWVPGRLSLNDDSKNIKIKLWFENFIRNSPEGKNKDEFINIVRDWIPNDKLSDKNNPNIEIRLKGAWPEHWSDEKQWSFKVKFNDENDQFLNLNRLALQPPWTLDYIYEWLLYKALEKEDLINLPVSFLEVILNNKSLGVYIIQGQVSDKLLIRNNKAISPVIGFTKDTWIKEQINVKKFSKIGATDSLNGLEDTFWRSRIEPVQFNKYKGNLTQETYLEKAIFLLESFRNGKMSASEVFDVNKLAKVMALRALIGSTEFDYLDTKFYYNPKTNLLEPITKEAHVNLNLNWRDYYFSWWIDSSKIRPHYTNNTNFFIDLLYKDKKFYATYLKQLNFYASNNFYEKLIQDNKVEFNKNLKILKMNYPTKKIFSEEHLKVTKTRVQDLLSPVEGLNVYFENYTNGILNIIVQNIQRLPIEILGVEFDNGKKILKEDTDVVDGKRPLNPSYSQSVKFRCNDILCSKANIESQKIIYKILGQTKEKTALIKPFYFLNNQ